METNEDWLVRTAEFAEALQEEFADHHISREGRWRLRPVDLI